MGKERKWKRVHEIKKEKDRSKRVTRIKGTKIENRKEMNRKGWNNKEK